MAPENTLLSVKKALECKVDMIEIDVHCHEKQILVIHDETLDRTTNGKGSLYERSFLELRKLDAGNGEKIPTLEEVIETVNKRVVLQIELKGGGTAISVARCIRKYIGKGWRYEDFLISSFNHREIKKVRELNSKIRIAPLIVGLPVDSAEFAAKLNAYSAHLSREFVDREFVADAHSKGIKVFVFTVNNSEELKRLQILGIDGVFSDRPDLLGYKVNPYATADFPT